MREHPLPQDVTGYQFHIIGNMTLKQFVEIGAGVVVGFIIYTTNLIPIIKWPLIGLSVAFGSMAAFVPFEERPLDHWMITFFKVIYHPTKFFWKKKAVIPDAFLYQSKDLPKMPVDVDFSPARRQRIKDFMTSISAPAVEDPYEAYVTQRVDSVLASFTSVVVNQTTINKQIVKPDLTVRVRGLKSEEAPDAMTTQTVGDASNLTTRPTLTVSQVAQEIDIPTAAQISVDSATAAPITDMDNHPQPTIPTEAVTLTTPNWDTPAPTAPVAETSATFNQDLPFPAPPTEPNKPVGMILGSQNELITDAIVEITTEAGGVVRAIKSNSLGQFFITTPLNQGSYVINVEKPGFVFTPQQLLVDGSILQPLELRAVATN